MLRTGLAAGDQPVNARQIQALQPSQQRLGRSEPDRGGHLTEAVCSMDEAAILDRDAHPYVRRPGQIRRKLVKAVFALGQDLKCVLLGLNHDLEHARDVLGRSPRGRGRSCCSRTRRAVTASAKPRSASARGVTAKPGPLDPGRRRSDTCVAPCASGEVERVAMCAPGRDPIATRRRVPHVRRPLDRGLGHLGSSPIAPRLLDRDRSRTTERSADAPEPSQRVLFVGIATVSDAVCRHA